MKQIAVATLTLVALGSATSSIQANDWLDIKPTSPINPWVLAMPPSPGWLNETLRAKDPYLGVWNVGALYWGRYEVKQNGGFTASGSLADFRQDVDNDNNYLLQRILPRIGYTGEWVEVFVQGRHSSVTSDERSSTGNGTLTVSTNGVVTASGPVGTGSSPESDGPLDLQQAYINLGNHKKFPVSLKLGRQELIFGEQRIVGPLAWNNIQRQWDAAKLRWQTPWFAAEAFSSMLVMPRDNDFNYSNDREIFSGLNLTTKKLPKLWSEFYFWSRNVSRDGNAGNRGTTPAPFRPPEAQDVYTIGTYLKNSTNDWPNVDFGFQGYYQFGNFADFREAAGLGPRRDHQAFAAIASAGYTWKESSKLPRLGIEYSFGSGDSNPNDGKHGTFVHLYPTGHLFYGYADFASLQNLHNLRLRSSFMPLPRLRVALEGHFRMLDNVNDNFYNVAGLPRGGITYQPVAARGTTYGINPSARSGVGQEVDLTVTWAINKFAVMEANYSHVFRGNYVKDSLARVGSQDADYFYLQLLLQF